MKDTFNLLEKIKWFLQGKCRVSSLTFCNEKEMHLLFFQAMEEISEDELDTVHDWATWTSFKHREVKGIWNKFAEKTDVTAIDGNEKAGVIAAGDENGLIKLLRFPSERRGAHFKQYVGHASPIGKSTFLYCPFIPHAFDC